MPGILVKEFLEPRHEVEADKAPSWVAQEKGFEDMATNVSRRSVAKGALWATPAVAIAASAPAMAASAADVTVSSTVCNLFYGTGGINNQNHNIYFGFTSSTGTIPAGTKVTHQVCVDPSTDPAGGTTWNIPTNTYPGGSSPTGTSGPWYISFTDASGNPLASGQQMTGKQCFNVVFTFNADTSASDMACLNGIIWNDTYQLRPASTITVTTDSAVTGATNGGSGTLAYKAARRWPNSVNTTGRSPHAFTSKGGLQTCYPSVSSSQQLQSDGADDVVCYPSGTNITTARCNWGGTYCTSSAAGLCTPVYKGGVAGQTNIPSMC